MRECGFTVLPGYPPDRSLPGHFSDDYVLDVSFPRDADRVAAVQGAAYCDLGISSKVAALAMSTNVPPPQGGVHPGPLMKAWSLRTGGEVEAEASVDPPDQVRRTLGLRGSLLLGF